MDNLNSRPNPDPTLLTTQQLVRELGSMREIIEARLNSMDAAAKLLQVGADRIPGLIAAAVSTLQQLHEEKFSSIAVQFSERDTRTEQASRDGKVAIDAALQAQKEAVGKQNESNAQAIAKSEAAFIKQIDQIGVLIATMTKNNDDKVGDIKDRLTAIEGQKKGGQDLWAYLFGAAGLAAAVITLAVLLITKAS